MDFVLAPYPTWSSSARGLQACQLHLRLLAPDGSPCSGFHFLSLPSFRSNLQPTPTPCPGAFMRLMG